jgi:hypothetical protein
LQAVFGNDTFDAADADYRSALTQLLGNDLRRGVGIEETVPDHLPDDLVRSSVVGLWTALPALQSQRTALLISGAKLKVTLLAVAEFLGGPQRSPTFTLAFDEHQQLAGHFVVLAYLQDPSRPHPRMALRFELCHLTSSVKSVACSVHAARASDRP